jgi:hypothetical protein
MKLYKLLIITSIFSIIVFSCINQNNDKVDTNKNIEEKNIIYYSERVVIFWCPRDEDYEKKIFNLPEEERINFENDLSYYNTMAMSYIIEKNEKIITDTTSIVGFVIGNDKIILDKKDFTDSLWKIILFDAKSLPIVVTPIEIVTNNEKYSNFFRD